MSVGSSREDLDFTVWPLARYLGIPKTDVIANRLNLARRLRDRPALPSVRRRSRKAPLMRDFAARHGIDMGKSGIRTAIPIINARRRRSSHGGKSRPSLAARRSLVRLAIIDLR